MSNTKRPVVSALEEIIGQDIAVLDHGFIRVIDYMGNDTAIVQAARVSYGQGTKQVRGDSRLINYLMRHNHSTPFEMCEIKLHIKAPIFVARQWLRHRTANVNEYSARYSILEREFYLPQAEVIAEQATQNAQGREKAVDTQTATLVRSILQRDALQCYDDYEKMLDQNISRELARMNLNLNYYTQWYWKIDLNNLLRFIRLRIDKHAQYEIREYAREILTILEKWLPLTYNAFVNHALDAYVLSKNSLAIIRQLLRGEKVTFTASNLSKREWKELIVLLQVDEERE